MRTFGEGSRVNFWKIMCAYIYIYTLTQEIPCRALHRKYLVATPSLWGEPDPLDPGLQLSLGEQAGPHMGYVWIGYEIGFQTYFGWEPSSHRPVEIWALQKCSVANFHFPAQMAKKGHFLLFFSGPLAFEKLRGDPRVFYAGSIALGMDFKTPPQPGPTSSPASSCLAAKSLVVFGPLWLPLVREYTLSRKYQDVQKSRARRRVEPNNLRPKSFYLLIRNF